MSKINISFLLYNNNCNKLVYFLSYFQGNSFFHFSKIREFCLGYLYVNYIYLDNCSRK